MYFTSCASIDRSNGGSLNRHPAGSYLRLSMLRDANAAVDAVYRSDWGRIVATLIRLVRDFDVAEEAAQEAFAAAVDQWRGSRGPPVPPPRVIHTAPAQGPHPHPPPARVAGEEGAHTPAGGATRGAALVRTDLCAEAIRLARLVRALMTSPPPEATALLALMLLHDSRRDTRLDEAGDLVLLEEQDRRRWHHDQIAEALPLVDEALRDGPGPFGLQAAIAALHCQAARAEDTDWPQIVRLYDLLERLQPSPIVSLNRAAAVAMADSPKSALVLIDALTAAGDLDRYYLLHSARADLLRRLGSRAEAARSYTRAIELCTNDAERRFLARRLREVQR